MNYLILDANIARSGSLGSSDAATGCFELAVLLQQTDCKTGLLMTPTIREEWKKHSSFFMSRWLATMVSRRRVRSERDRRVSDFRLAIETIDDEGMRCAIEKDAHLSEAAIFHGVPVASRDDRQRRHLTRLGGAYPLATKIQWFNPTSDTGWQNWVRDGCTDQSIFTCCDANTSQPEKGSAAITDK